MQLKAGVNKVSDPILLQASTATNFTYALLSKSLTQSKIIEINKAIGVTDKFKLLNKYDVAFKFEQVDNPVFRSNLQTIDYYFDKILSELLVYYYTGENEYSKVSKLIEKLTLNNSLKYDLRISSIIYEIIMRRFLTDCAFGMKATEVWKRKYPSAIGYLAVKEKGDIQYHIFFTKSFGDYLFNNTGLEAPSPSKYKFGKIYSENGVYKIKLNLQVRFTK